MSWAADAAGHPNPQALKDSDCLFVGQYVGTAYQHFGVSRGYIDECLSIGLGVMLIFEEWSSQFLGGYDTARQMMNRMHTSWDALGVPNDGSVCPAVALVDPTPSAVYGHEDELRAFARGVSDGCWLPWFTGYGSRYGLDIAQPFAPKMQRRWGVGTWGFGERGDGSLPADVPADMIQHGNRGAPVGGTDYNTLFRNDMGQWGGPVTVPVTPAQEDVMYIAVGDQAFLGHIAFCVDGGYRVGEPFTGPAPNYGIPQSAIDWNTAGGRDLRYVFLDSPRLEVVFSEQPADGGGGGGGVGPISDADVARIVDAVNDDAAKRMQQ